MSTNAFYVKWRPTRRRRPPAWVAPDTVCADYALAAEGFVVLGGPLGGRRGDPAHHQFGQ